MKELIFVVGKSGEVTGVQQDALNLSEIGHVTNTRASTVEWDEGAQLWKAVIKPEFIHPADLHYWKVVCSPERRKCSKPPWVFFDHSRQTCVDWEIEYLNQKVSTAQKIN